VANAVNVARRSMRITNPHPPHALSDKQILGGLARGKCLFEPAWLSAAA
jgi:hypothetical protein